MCTHSICQGEVVCVCIFVSVEGLREGRIGRRKEEGQIKAEQWQKGRRGQHRQENVLSHSLSLSRSLSYPPTHSSKYNDHRKVISKLSQSEDGESTESKWKKHKVKRALDNCFQFTVFMEINRFQ